MTNPTCNIDDMLEESRWYAATQDLRDIDCAFDAVAQVADEKVFGPTLLITKGEFFQQLVPKSLHDCPAYLIWLPRVFSSSIFELAYALPTLGERTTATLTKRDLVFRWATADLAFTSFLDPLRQSMMEQHDNGAISVIFATDTHTAITALPIDVEFLEYLVYKDGLCNINYDPSYYYSRDQLKAATMRKRDPDEFEFDDAGRKVVLLKSRRVAPSDYRAW